MHYIATLFFFDNSSSSTHYEAAAARWINDHVIAQEISTADLS